MKSHPSHSMSHQTFYLICAGLIAIPFLVSCIKGIPAIGFLVGFVSLLVMGFMAGHGATMFEIHAVGFVIAGLGISWTLHGDW